MVDKVALFPGSFDPITKGHEDIIKRALPLFDRIIVAIGVNATKKYMFSLEERAGWIKKTFEKESKIEVQTYEGLTVDYCKKVQARFILRGLRNPADFEFEKAIAQMNRDMTPEIETVFLLTRAQFAAISSSIVRDIIRNKGSVDPFVPEGVLL